MIILQAFSINLKIMETNSSFNSFFKKLQTIFAVIMTMEIIALITALAFQREDTKWVIENPDSLFMASCIGIIVLSALSFLGNNRANKALLESDLAVKLEKYRSGMLFSWAMGEIMTLALCFCYYISGHKFYLFVALLEIVYFLLKRPDQYKLSREFGLNEG